MPDNNNIDKLRKDWDSRQKLLGNNLNSVLFKNFPSFMNKSLHKRHVEFIINNIPHGSSKLLDLGCGYGRVSDEILKSLGNIKISGVDLSEEFCKAFNMKFESCYHGSIQDFNSEDKYNVILMITVLMYLDKQDIQKTLSKYWNLLEPGGRIICIEPIDNILISTRKHLNLRSFKPTSGNVTYFTSSVLMKYFSQIDDARIIELKTFGIFPFINKPSLHMGIAIEKDIT